MIEKFDPLKGEKLQILAETGEVRPELEPRLADVDLRKIYSLMVTTRAARFMNDLIAKLKDADFLKRVAEGNKEKWRQFFG